MIDLIQLIMHFVLCLLLKLNQVNDFFMQDFEVVFLVELKNANAKVIWIQVNT
jgi:hypothetical protein